MRGSDTDASIYYLAVMLEGGEDPRFVARRMVGLRVRGRRERRPARARGGVAAARAVEFVGMPECRINLSQAAAYLARAPKSNASYVAIASAMRDVRERGNLRPPPHLRDTSYAGAKRLGHGAGYVYPHDRPEEAAKQQYLPDELAGTRYYPEDAPGA